MIEKIIHSDIRINCAVCDGETAHLDMGTDVPWSVRFKCKRCGEYNMQKTIADRIMEPLKHVSESLQRLETDSQGIPPVLYQIAMIVGELEGAMAVVRQSVESLLEATMGPEADEDAPVPGGENYKVIEANGDKLVRYGGDPN